MHEKIKLKNIYTIAPEKINKAACKREFDKLQTEFFQKLPEKGMIQIFNRSHYEDILVPTIKKTLPDNIIEQRYTQVYEEILNRCSPEIPWVIVPADIKWYRNYCVASTIVKELKQLNLKFPNKRK